MSTIHVTPEVFTLIAYDAGEIASVCEDAAAVVEFPPAVNIEITVDEELFAPLVGHMSDIVDGVAHIWISGGNLEDKRRPRTFSREQTRDDLVVALLRAKDRLSPDFMGAPNDGALSRAERAAWDVSAHGRAGQLGVRVREQALRYEFRLQHGFSDNADAAFDRLFAANATTWEGIREICRETGAVDRPPSKVPVDLLRQS